MITLSILKLGGEYHRGHARRLHEQVTRHNGNFILLTDDEVLLQEPWTRSLTLTLPGWWGLLEKFAFPGPVLCVGLDTTIRGSLEPVERFVNTVKSGKMVGFLKPKGAKRVLGTGASAWSGDFTYHWDWLRKQDIELLPGSVYGRLRINNKVFEDDQEVLYHLFRYRDYVNWPASLAQRYKSDLKQQHHRATAPIIVFNGRPRPWECLHV